MPPVGFEPTTSAGERPQTYALDRAATETGVFGYISDFFTKNEMAGACGACGGGERRVQGFGGET